MMMMMITKTVKRFPSVQRKCNGTLIPFDFGLLLEISENEKEKFSFFGRKIRKTGVKAKIADDYTSFT